MTQVSDAILEKYRQPTLEFLKANPGRHPIFKLHRAVAISANYGTYTAVLYRLVQEGVIECHKIGPRTNGYCLPGYQGHTPYEDAKYRARLKIQQFLPGCKPVCMDQLHAWIHFSPSTIRPVLRELVAEGQVRLIEDGNNKFYQWVVH